MRVVGGKAKGRRLKGTLSPGARPTTERVRSAIFNILTPDIFRDGHVLDLYAGSGSLGIEALSRGAAWADFLEQNRRQCDVIQANLADTGLKDQARVYCTEVEKGLAGLAGPYRLVMLDPPYRFLELGRVLETIASIQGLVEDDGTVVVGHSRHLELQSLYGNLHLFSHRRYGDNVVDFFHKGENGW
ncbi:MAG: 16S rRNA (guanine(966)-N(2))-methyltransferase RsmD [SAR202 cluster bacterium Io17-Chloro-G9]|nr:MAG: 16S rRNA (guanine(966)-N(2))-methyltransferase RsmD [SAR202 cluster bacterium Io17-Chloro-G9]